MIPARRVSDKAKKNAGLTPKTGVSYQEDSFQSHGSSTRHNISESLDRRTVCKVRGYA
jgi:hypothetical protein